ncbi:MAG: ABC transporter ATP-binding protein [Planctomycetota bacterium]|jgi:iron complex transport system ATP-binding protein
MKPIITVKNLCFDYDSKQKIFDGLSFAIMPNDFLAVAGPNGAGKTTLLNLLCGLLRADAGTVEVESRNIASYTVKNIARKIAIVRQEFLPVFDFKVSEIVSMARIPYLGTFGFEGKVDRKKIEEAFELTDTTGFASRTLGQLSSGERQRVLIARALAQDAPVLLLDEPTSFLDLKHQVDMYDLLRKMQLEKNKTIVAVTHDINLAVQYCDKALLLGNDKSFLYGVTKEVLCREKIEEFFGVKTFVGTAGGERFFIPVGEFAKDSSINNQKESNNRSSL